MKLRPHLELSSEGEVSSQLQAIKEDSSSSDGRTRKSMMMTTTMRMSTMMKMAKWRTMVARTILACRLSSLSLSRNVVPCIQFCCFFLFVSCVSFFFFCNSAPLIYEFHFLMENVEFHVSVHILLALAFLTSPCFWTLLLFLEVHSFVLCCVLLTFSNCEGRLLAHLVVSQCLLCFEQK